MAVSLTTKLSPEASYLAGIRRLNFVSVHPKSSMWREFTRRVQRGVKVDLNFRFRQIQGLVSNETGVLRRREVKHKSLVRNKLIRGKLPPSLNWL